MTNIDEEILDRLEAEAKVADAEAEELTIAVESDIEQKDAEVEELQEDLQEKESEVEELQSEIEEKETMVEELQEEVNAVAETYAEELAARSDVLDKDEYLDKFDFEELREKHDDLEIESSPNPNSGDPGAGFQTADDPEAGNGGEPEELSEKAEAAVESFERRARQSNNEYWTELAEDIKENGLGEARLREDEDELFE